MLIHLKPDVDVSDRDNVMRRIWPDHGLIVMHPQDRRIDKGLRIRGENEMLDRYGAR